MTQGGGKDIYLVCDPPFGGRVEPISQTIKTISESHKKWNNLHSDDDELKILFVFPYFMESVIKLKSNPPGVTGGLSALEMTDYKVEYDNHPVFHGKTNAMKPKSPVRIFTNVKSSLLVLPESDGYKYCGLCQRWVAPENSHCEKCEKCTSKDGRQYKHCDLCTRCVKSSWDHCNICKRCTLKTHECHTRPRVVGKCFLCNKTGKFTLGKGHINIYSIIYESTFDNPTIHINRLIFSDSVSLSSLILNDTSYWLN